MKNKQIYITLILIIASVFPTFGQWKMSTFEPNTHQLYDVSFPTENCAYALGYAGDIYKSIDGGVNWEEIQGIDNASETLSDINFINADIGFVSTGVPGLQYYYRTFNGGNNWELMTSDQNWWFNFAPERIKIVDHILYGSYANVDTTFVLKSNDYGTNWTVLFTHIETNASAFKLSFLDELNAYLVNPNNLTEIYKTSDGCTTFDTITVVNNPLMLQREMHFTENENYGYFYGSLAWQFSSLSSVHINGQNNTQVLSTNFHISDIIPALDMDFNTSKIYASSFYGKILWTSDFGIIWNEQITPTEENIGAIEFVNENKGIAISGNSILYTTNGGASLSINEIVDLSESIRIYPNPTSDKFQINVDKAIELEQINLIDIHGKRVETLKKATLEVDVSTFSQGAYFVEMITKQGRHIQKLIVE